MELKKINTLIIEGDMVKNFKFKNVKKIVYYNLIIFSILYILLEIFSGSLIYKNKLDCTYLSCNRTFYYNFITPEGEVKNYYKKDKWGFRGREKNVKDLDIIVVGGSTTNEKFISLKNTWSEQLEKLFLLDNKDIDVVNAGIDGQSTDGHIWNFEEWFTKIPNLKTKYIIFYFGINEKFPKISSKNDQKNIKQSKYSVIDSDKNFSVGQWLSDIIKMSNLKYGLVYFIKKNNGITFKIYKTIYKNYIYKNNVYLGHYEIQKDYFKPTKQIVITAENEKFLLNKLKKIKALSNKMGAEPIFITQKSIRGVKIDSKILSIDLRDFYSYEKKLSKIIINFCDEEDLRCVDLNALIKFENDDFYDPIHTNKNGSKKISELLYLSLADLKF